MIKNIRQKNKKGFTVFEAIVAIGILSLAIAGVFATVQHSLSQSINSKYEIKAFYLAQEAIDFIRNRRDNNQLARIGGDVDVDWLDGLAANSSDPCYPGKTCTVDVYYDYIGACWGDWTSCPPLHQDTSAPYLYSYCSTWPDSKFTRSVKIERIDSNEIAVIVKIMWTQGTANKEFEVKTYLFNWI